MFHLNPEDAIRAIANVPRSPKRGAPFLFTSGDEDVIGGKVSTMHGLNYALPRARRGTRTDVLGFERTRLLATTDDIFRRMSELRKAFDAGRKAVQESFAEGKSYDPAGQGNDQARLRGMGKWRFVLIRGIVGFSVPMFLFLALSDLSRDIHTARAFHQPMLRYLFGHWLVGLCISASLGIVVGLLAWRRIVSDVWPGAEPDSESCTITLGPLSRQ